MKIAILGPAYPLRGGIANFNESLCRTFLQRGDQCHIYSYYLQYPEFLFPGKTQLAGDDPSPGLPVTSSLSSVNPLSWRNTARLIRNQRPDLVIVRYWLPFMAPSLGTTLKWMRTTSFRPPVIAITDNIVPHEHRPGDKMLTRYFLKQCDGFVVMSEQVKNDLLSFGVKQPVQFQPHPVYDIFGEAPSKAESRRILGLNPDGNYVLFFGFIRKYKGLDLLLKAMADERIRAAGVKLIVAGEFYDDPKEYTDLIDTLNLRETVILHDRYIPKEAVKHYFGACDLVAQPYRDATQSGVTQIAYHFGKPMLVTNVGGLPEMVPHGEAGYVVSTDPDHIAAAIFNFYKENREETLTAGVQKHAVRFSWKSLAEGILRLCDEL